VLALVVCYAPVLRGMCEQWRLDEDMGHGFAVAPVALWIVWRERKRLDGVAPQPSAWGLALLATGAAFHAISTVGAGLFAGALGFVLSVTGLVLLLGGAKYLRVWLFPLLLTVFMLPKLAVLYNMVTLPMQLAASRMAERTLLLSGIAVTREGNILDAGKWRVAVVEACNGLRYLLSLGFVGVIFAYLSDPKPWMRAALLAAAVPIAILANALRVAFTVAIGMRSPALAGEPYHSILGWLVFVLCLVAMWAAQKGLNRLYGRLRA
jgi:exosortase